MLTSRASMRGSLRKQVLRISRLVTYAPAAMRVSALTEEILQVISEWPPEYVFLIDTVSYYCAQNIGREI